MASSFCSVARRDNPMHYMKKHILFKRRQNHFTYLIFDSSFDHVTKVIVKLENGETFKFIVFSSHLMYPLYSGHISNQVQVCSNSEKLNG